MSVDDVVCTRGMHYQGVLSNSSTTAADLFSHSCLFMSVLHPAVLLLPPLCCLQHDFRAADDTVGNHLLPAVASLCTELDQQLDAAEEVMQCCHMGRANIVSQALLTMLACAGGAGVFCALVGIAMFARLAKRKAVKQTGLPTYGLPMYSGKLGTWSL